jgi:hypothetical protein
MTDITRRSWLAQSGVLSAVVPFTASDLSGEKVIARDKRLRVVVVGAHPDDPESSCGGTMARYSDLGHEVFAADLDCVASTRAELRGGTMHTLVLGTALVYGTLATAQTFAARARLLDEAGIPKHTVEKAQAEAI